MQAWLCIVSCHILGLPTACHTYIYHAQHVTECTHRSNYNQGLNYTTQKPLHQLALGSRESLWPGKTPAMGTSTSWVGYFALRNCQILKKWGEKETYRWVFSGRMFSGRIFSGLMFSLVRVENWKTKYSLWENYMYYSLSRLRYNIWSWLTGQLHNTITKQAEIVLYFIIWPQNCWLNFRWSLVVAGSWHWPELVL